MLLSIENIVTVELRFALQVCFFYSLILHLYWLVEFNFEIKFVRREFWNEKNCPLIKVLLTIRNIVGIEVY